MPKQVKNYANGQIYKLVCRDVAVKDIYVGSTTNFESRKKNHRNKSSKPVDRSYNYPVYVFMRAHGGWYNWQMILIEVYPCANKLALEQRENHWAQLLQSTLNTTTPANPYVRAEHKEELAAYNRQYAIDNREAIAVRAKANREANQERRAQQHAAWIAQPFVCQCGSSMTMGAKNRHLKSKIHAATMLTIATSVEAPAVV